uniref:Uncharacterized protein n=1 Tax=Avena sativa TaxID=4498 RepID=A0ACD5XJC5_AVESA
MGSCVSCEKGAVGERKKDPAERQSQIAPTASPSEMSRSEVSKGGEHTTFISNHGLRSPSLTYEELDVATERFAQEHFLGKGGFGEVYKGVLDGNHVAIKILNPKGMQGTREFFTEVMVLNRLDHPNLVKLVGYCAEWAQKLLVYEYMPLGSLETHLFDLPPDKKPLDWNTRMKILAGAAQGLQHLHVNTDPPIINRDVKCSNILLGEGYHPKLSDFGLAKLGPTGDDTHVSTRVMGTPGYCAPEYLESGQLTLRSDIYSFGVVILEVITGRRALDQTRSRDERNLAEWATPLINQKEYSILADPALSGQYSKTSLVQALSVAQLCIQKTARQRPLITEVASALSHISSRRSGSSR